MTTPTPRQLARGFPTLPPIFDFSDPIETLRAIFDAVQLHNRGKFNVTGTLTLAANQTTTTITDTRVGPNSFIQLMPTTENAGGEVGWWISSRGKQTFEITHANDSRTDRTFTFVILG